jgi:hypothetical protein
MPWFNVDDAIPDMAEVHAIPRRYRLAAMGLWNLAGGWVSKHLTDGFIPDDIIELLGGTAVLKAQLIGCGLWCAAPGGAEFTGQGCRWPTAEGVNKTRQQTKKRVQEHRGRQSGGPPDNLRRPSGQPPEDLRTTSGQPPDNLRTTSGNGHKVTDQGVVVDVTPLQPDHVTALHGIGMDREGERCVTSSPSPEPPVTKVGDGTRPSAVSETSQLINAAKPCGVVLDRRTRRGLHEEVLALLGDGAEPGDVAEVLREWFSTADVYPGHIGHMHTELIKRRKGVLRKRDSHEPEVNGHRLTRTDQRIVELQQRKFAQQPRKELP